VSEAQRENPYAAPATPLADTGPPSRFLLTCTVVLHGFWCAASAVAVLGLFAFESASGRLLPSGVLAFTFLYGFTIWQLFRKRRWAWRVSWLPIIAMLFFGTLATIGAFLSRKPHGPDASVFLWMIAVVIVPAIALTVLQWTARREL